jgi:ADP-heptose:LPS heptosyltransferase
MNILISRHDKIGDFVTMLPVCKVLKEQTGHRIVMLVSKVNVDLAKELDFIDEVIEYTEDTEVLLKTIRSYDFAVSISGYIDSALGKVLFRSRIPKRIAPATKMAQIFFNTRVKQRRSLVEKREFEYNLDLLKAFDESLILDFEKPLLDIRNSAENTIKKDFIIFHPGFGGSSDGNLLLDDYLKLAKKASEVVTVVFSFGPDDQVSKQYIEDKLDFPATIKDDFKTLMEFSKYIATSKLFVSTSTGPMHLAGLTNTKTLSFFGATLFASPKRWATISEASCQNNFTVPLHYSDVLYTEIESKLMELIHA